MQLGVQSQGDFRRADGHELVLVVLNVAKLANDFLQYIIPSWADI